MTIYFEYVQDHFRLNIEKYYFFNKEGIFITDNHFKSVLKQLRDKLLMFVPSARQYFSLSHRIFVLNKNIKTPIFGHFASKATIAYSIVCFRFVRE